MFFSGETTSRRVDLSGRSGKQQDRKKLLDQARLDRERRARLRLELQSATRIQRFWRGRRAVEKARPEFRSEWQRNFGQRGELTDSSLLRADSKCLPQLLFFCRASDVGDLCCLASACRVILRSLSSLRAAEAGSAPLEGEDASWKDGALQHRVGRLSLFCLRAVHLHRQEWKDQLLARWRPPDVTTCPLAAVLLETVVCVHARGRGSPRSLHYLASNGLFPILRDLLLLKPRQPALTAPAGASAEVSLVEHAASLLSIRHMDNPRWQESEADDPEMSLPPRLRFSHQIASVPLLCQQFSAFAEAFRSSDIWRHTVHALNGPASGPTPDGSRAGLALPPSTGPRLPPPACLLGNILANASSGFAVPHSRPMTVLDFTRLARLLLEVLPSLRIASPSPADADDAATDGWGQGDSSTSAPLEPEVAAQLSSVGDSAMLSSIVRMALPALDGAAAAERGADGGPAHDGPGGGDPELVGSLCAFLYVARAALPRHSTRLLSGLAYGADLVPRLWAYIRKCHLANAWPPLQLGPSAGQLSPDAGEPLNWMLPLVVFCPVYSFALETMDNEEFYDQQRLLKLEDLSHLVVVLREAVWQLLWVDKARPNPGQGLWAPAALLPAARDRGGQEAQQAPFRSTLLAPSEIRRSIAKAAAHLLAQLYERNSARQFVEPDTFHARSSVEESFFAQAEGERGRAHELLKEAPFLVPFKDRVRIYTTMLSAARQKWGTPFRGVKVSIRRDRIVEDSFAQLHSLPDELWHGTIRVEYVNELGLEEAGVDGGGIFKDFLENITRSAFDVQFGLFKEASGHLLYPNPASAIILPNHLEFFEFVGKILGKAMLEGILVDIPFATFFLSKLRNKYNYLHDLPSLDPELYRSLLFLKHYEGDVSDLGIYFVVESNEFGEVEEKELIPGGRDIPVRNADVFRYIWLVANYKLNIQIQAQGRAFFEGFKSLINPELVAMFNESELQMLISGSQEGMDLEDLREHTNYTGGYHENHPVIQMLWDVLFSLDLDLQHKFLKFATGCSRGPLLGFRHLEPRFCIQRAAPDNLSLDTLDRLPTSATCMNLLKLPPYQSKEAMRDKLLYAITAGAGFDLS